MTRKERRQTQNFSNYLSTCNSRNNSVIAPYWTYLFEKYIIAFVRGYEIALCDARSSTFEIKFRFYKRRIIVIIFCLFQKTLGPGIIKGYGLFFVPSFDPNFKTELNITADDRVSNFNHPRCQ